MKRQTIGKNGKPRFFKSDEGKAWVEELTWRLSPYRPKKPLEGPLSMCVVFIWPLNKGDQDTKAKREALEETPWIWHDTKPDWDNAPKTLMDVMEKLGFYGNDSQIVMASVEKYRGVKPGIFIAISEIEDWEVGLTISMAMDEPDYLERQQKAVAHLGAMARDV